MLTAPTRKPVTDFESALLAALIGMDQTDLHGGGHSPADYAAAVQIDCLCMAHLLVRHSQIAPTN